MKSEMTLTIAAVFLIAAVFNVFHDTPGPSQAGDAEGVILETEGHPPFLPVYRIPARIHLGSSLRTPHHFRDILAEINLIWLSQAGICFEIEVVMNDEPAPHGLDLWFMPRLNGNDTWNGLYIDSHNISVRDTPLLNPAPVPARHPAARTAAHEFGHALGLGHRQDSDDNLMRSKTYGWRLSEGEITTARANAVALALPDQESLHCRLVFQSDAQREITPRSRHR